jgi:putative acetyltransferase
MLVLVLKLNIGGIMELRKYKSEDCTTLAELFFNTVHTINSKDYSKAQLDVWATGNVDISAWNQSFLEHNTVVAEINGIIVGFGDMDNNGYLDKLFVHRDYQSQGIASAIVNELEQRGILQGISIFTTHASITAKPFFETSGYCVVRENIVIRNNLQLTNFIMEKKCARIT